MDGAPLGTRYPGPAVAPRSFRSLRSLGRALGVALAVLLAASPAGALDDDGAAAAEALVRGVWFEGMPFDQARAIGPAGAARLAALLSDPNDRVVHANALIATGIAAAPGAFEVLRAYAAIEPEGAVDAATYDARIALPLAFGHLAREDDRALAALLERARAPVAPPTWSYRSLRGARLAAALREAVATGLAVSGRPEAAAALEGLVAGSSAVGERDDRSRSAASPEPDAGLVPHVAAMRALHGRVASEGPEAVFDAHLPGTPR